MGFGLKFNNFSISRSLLRREETTQAKNAGQPRSGDGNTSTENTPQTPQRRGHEAGLRSKLLRSFNNKIEEKTGVALTKLKQQSVNRRYEKYIGGKELFKNSTLTIAEKGLLAAQGLKHGSTGLNAANETYLKHASPELYKQMEALTASGWTIEERPLESRGDYIAHKRIVIDPRIAIGDPDIPKLREPQDGKEDARFAALKKPNPHAYLCALAHQVGCAIDAGPISLQTRDDYIRDSLRHEANGVWNELHVREGILKKRAAISGRTAVLNFRHSQEYMQSIVKTAMRTRLSRRLPMH